MKVHAHSFAGTASVTVAGLIAAGRLTGRRLSDDTYLFVGAGEVSNGSLTPTHVYTLYSHRCKVSLPNVSLFCLGC